MSDFHPINSVAKVRRGASPRPINNPDYFGGSVGWVRINDVTASSKYLRKTTQYLSPLGESKSVRVDRGDLVMSICGTVGIPIIVDMPACIHDGFVQLYDINGADTEYLYYSLQFSRAEFLSRGQPGTQLNLNTTIVGKQEIFLPSLPEQKKIAAILSSVDAAIEAQERQIAKLKELKKAMMQELLTKGVGRDGQPHTRFKDSPVGRIPEGWEIVTIGQLADFFNGNAFKSSEWTDNGLPIIRIQNLNGDMSFNYFSGEVKDRWYVPKGTLLFAWSGQRGKSFGARLWQGPAGVLNQHIFKVTENSRVILKEFLLLLLQHVQIEIERSAHGFKDSFMHVKKSDLTDQEVALPSKEEQYHIVQAVGSAEQRILLAEVKLDRKKQIKKALMQDLLTGKVRVKVD